MKSPPPSFAKIPSMQEIDSYLSSRGKPFGREVKLQVKEILKEIRTETDWINLAEVTREDILQKISTRLEKKKHSIIPLMNATGTVIHTNLGRSVFSSEVLEALLEPARSYTNLEFSLETGKRGSRLDNVSDLLRNLTGAEDAVVVNNNASAILLALSALAADEEIIVSRGELVEIGGSFRIPEIIDLAGGVIREVGTTNRTHLSDYRSALNEKSRVILKVHNSNYKIIGFTESASVKDLAPLAKESDTILVNDIGSGALVPFAFAQLNQDPTIKETIEDGADVVTFSGDKLLGGPQAGIIVGKASLLQKMKKHPLYRAFRCDKISMILLEQTLLAYARKEERKRVPTQRMLNESAEEVKKRGEAILSAVEEKASFALTSCSSTPGGGSFPETEIPSYGIEVNSSKLSADRILTQLRNRAIPLIARIHNDKVLLDCRTLLDHQIELAAAALQELAVDL